METLQLKVLRKILRINTTFIDRENWKCVHISGNKNKKMENNYVNRPLFDKNKHMVFDGYENYN